MVVTADSVAPVQAKVSKMIEGMKMEQPSIQPKEPSNFTKPWFGIPRESIHWNPTIDP